MAITSLNNESKEFSDGLDGVVVLDNYTSKRGGVSLNVAGYPLPNIRAGHVIIKQTSSGEFKPMPVVLGNKNGVATVGTVVAGSAYTNGTYENVPLNGGTGSGATGTVTVAGAIVTGITVINKGNNYTVGDVLTFDSSLAGGTGSGASVTVATVTNVNTTYASLPDGHTYAGHAVNSVLTSKAMVGVMFHGVINNNIVQPDKGVFSLASILVALKTALPQMMYKGDNA